MDVGARIAAWCEIRGISLQQLAADVGVSYAAVFQWVHGCDGKVIRPLLSHLEKVVEVLGVTMEEFYGPLPKTKRKKAKRSAA